VTELPAPAFKDERFIHGAPHCIPNMGTQGTVPCVPAFK
jgi:hypothetical protein